MLVSKRDGMVLAGDVGELLLGITLEGFVRQEWDGERLVGHGFALHRPLSLSRYIGLSVGPGQHQKMYRRTL